MIDHGIGHGISRHPNITMEMIKENPDKPWGREVRFLVIQILPWK